LNETPPRFQGRTLVFQPRPGLGDLIWHLPLIRAIASATETGRIILFTKPSTQADTLLLNDPAIDQIAWFDRNPRASEGRGRGHHDGPLGFPRLVITLRACHAETAVLLHHGASLAAALRLAGIPHRYGYNTTPQRKWLNTTPALPPEVQHAEAFDQATAYAAALGLTNLPEPSVRVDQTARQAVAARLATLPRPWTALGIGSNGAIRQWGAANFAALATARLARAPGSILLLAAAHENAFAESVAAAIPHPARVRIAAGWPLAEIVALLAIADLFIGNDSGLMNLRAATAQEAYGLFGASGPLRHSTLIRAIVPPGGARAGMSAISVRQVLDSLESDERR
jgi:heptosyltransferase-2